MIARRNGRRAALAAVSLSALAVLNGCATLGGNIKGDFSCRAPDGICAPSSTIDDRALAMISGDAGDTMIPAGPYQAPAQQPRAMRTAASVPAPMPDRSAVPGSRTREKAWRVAFQPYVDDRGRLHEASAVHTVVQSEWQAQALADATPIPDRNPAARATEVSLSEVVDRDAPGYIDVAAIDPTYPTPPSLLRRAPARPIPSKPSRRTCRASWVSAASGGPRPPRRRPRPARGRRRSRRRLGHPFLFRRAFRRRASPKALPWRSRLRWQPRQAWWSIVVPRRERQAS